MRVFSADYIVPIITEPIKNGYLVCDNFGLIEGVYKTIPKQFSAISVEFYEGILCPGFVNTHCHLELSHLKNKIKEKTGLANFIKEVQQIRDDSIETIEQAFIDADSEMYKNGIVAVGDICNSLNTLKVKKNSKLYYHNFVEIFGLTTEKAKINLKNAKEIKYEFANNSKSSLTPHANYSVSDFLFDEINKEEKEFLTIHNQESEAENEFFQKKTGTIFKQLQNFGIDLSNWQHPKKSALQSILPKLNSQAKIQLVHNTYTSKSDIEFANNYSNNIYWCFCPNANKYIENMLPNIPVFMQLGCKIVLGTDSIASNYQLSILEELKTIQTSSPKLSIFELLKWATLNGAYFLGINNVYGSFEKGKKPGVIQVKGLNYNQLNLKKETKAIRIL